MWSVSSLPEEWVWRRAALLLQLLLLWPMFMFLIHLVNLQLETHLWNVVKISAFLSTDFFPMYTENEGTFSLLHVTVRNRAPTNLVAFAVQNLSNYRIIELLRLEKTSKII